MSSSPRPSALALAEFTAARAAAEGDAVAAGTAGAGAGAGAGADSGPDADAGAEGGGGAGAGTPAPAPADTIACGTASGSTGDDSYDISAATGHPVLENLPGGRGLTWRCGDLILRPSGADAETTWKAEILAELEHTTQFCTPRPVPAHSGGWSVDGWEAWQWLPGSADESRVSDVLRAGAAFHAALASLDRPAFLDASDDPWARADRIAWEEEPMPENETLRLLEAAFRPVLDPSQIVHGDLLGNVMFAPGRPPAIIDWAPYWRPTGYADAIVVADAACWHGLPPRRMHELLNTDGQYLIRALAFRIATFELLGAWDAQMEERHRAAVEFALAGD